MYLLSRTTHVVVNCTCTPTKYRKFGQIHALSRKISLPTFFLFSSASNNCPWNASEAALSSKQWACFSSSSSEIARWEDWCSLASSSHLKVIQNTIYGIYRIPCTVYTEYHVRYIQNTMYGIQNTMYGIYRIPYTVYTEYHVRYIQNTIS